MKIIHAQSGKSTAKKGGTIGGTVKTLAEDEWGLQSGIIVHNQQVTIVARQPPPGSDPRQAAPAACPPDARRGMKTSLT